MSREEDLIRSTTHAIASTVREVPPLRLEPLGDELRFPARGPRRGRGRPRRWWSWGAPLTAAALVTALAIMLVLVRDVPNGSLVAATPTTSTSTAGVPRYYVALKQLAGFGYSSHSSTQPRDIVVGDSLTGKTLATFTSPADTVFESVTAAADDRTFVVFGVTSSKPLTPFTQDAIVTGNWWEVRLAPGTANPARLTRLPIKPLSVPGSDESFGLSAFADSFGTVLSGSGQELAVPEWAAPPGRLTVKVFSVATGQLLHEWTTSDLREQPSLAWIDGDRELALVSLSTSVKPTKFEVDNVTVREWPVAGPSSGDLVADSRVVWHEQIGTGTSWNPTTLQSCIDTVTSDPVLISADGKTFSCTTAGGSGATDHLSFHTYPLPADTAAATQGRIDYQVTFQGEGRYSPEVLWTSPSGDTLIGALFPGSAGVANSLQVGVISQGKFTPLRIPASLAASTVAAMAF